MTDPIIDAHHHIWRVAKIPWLSGPQLPRIFGDYSALRRDYPVGELIDDIKPSNVVKPVCIQINVAPGGAPARVARRLRMMYKERRFPACRRSLK